jgi:hypothetical protein
LESSVHRIILPLEAKFTGEAVFDVVDVVILLEFDDLIE